MVPVECGMHTAEHVKNAKLELIDGMGHDLPPLLTDRLADLIAGHTKSVVIEQPA